MRALRLHAMGSWKGLRLEQVARPEPDEVRPVLVRMRAASVNPVDLKSCAGRPPDPSLAKRLPLTPGYDVAGEVVAVARPCGLLPRQRVCGMVGFPSAPGTWAEHVAARAEELVVVPNEVSDAQAAALPMAGLTAWQALFSHGRLAPGETVLVTGASGGVGQLLVQLAYAHGARVIATCSARHRAVVTALGVDVVVDYAATRLDAVAERIDLVVNGVTGARDVPTTPGVGASTRRLSLVSLPKDDEALSRFFGPRPLVRADPGALAALLERVAGGRLRSRIVAESPLDDHEPALTLLDSGHPGGKALLRPPS